MIKQFAYVLFILTACSSNTTHTQKTLVWTELCKGYGSGPPIFVLDGIPIHPDSILNTTANGENLIIKNGREPITIRPDDIEKVEVMEVPAETVGDSPDKCTILIMTKKFGLPPGH